MTIRAAVLVAVLSVLLSVGVRILGYNGYLRLPFDIYRYTEIRNILYWGPFPEAHWPYFRFPFQYHPLIAWISGAISIVTDNIGLFMLLWASILAAAAGATAYVLGRQVAPWRVMLFWSASPQLLVLSGLNFDTIPTFTLVAAAAAVAAERRALASALLAVGAAAKVFPLAALPLVVLDTARRASVARAALVAAVGLGVLALIDGPAILAPYSLLSYGQRGPFMPAESKNLWLSCNCNPDNVWIIFGILAEWFVQPAIASVLTTVVTTAGLVITYVWLCVWPAWRGEPLGGLFYRSAVVILLWTRLYSPQYAIWVLPVLTLLVPRPSLLGLLALGDVVTFVTIFAIGQGAVGPLGADESAPAIGLMLFGLLARHAGLVLLLRGMLSARVPAAATEPAPPAAVGWGRAYAGLLAITIVGGVAVNSWVPSCTTTFREWNDFVGRATKGNELLVEVQQGAGLETLHDSANAYRRLIDARPVPCSVVAEVADLERALSRLSSAATAEELTLGLNEYVRAYARLTTSEYP